MGTFGAFTDDQGAKVFSDFERVNVTNWGHSSMKQAKDKLSLCSTEFEVIWMRGHFPVYGYPI